MSLTTDDPIQKALDESRARQKAYEEAAKRK